MQAVHHAAAILHLHTVKDLPHAAHIGLRGLHAEIAAEHIADALGVHGAVLAGIVGIASVVMDTGVDDLTGERRKDLAVDQAAGYRNALRLRIINGVLIHGAAGDHGNGGAVQQSAQGGVHFRCIVFQAQRRNTGLAVGLRHIKNTPDFIAVILPSVLHIGVRHADLHAVLIAVDAAPQPVPHLQAIDVGDLRVLRHRQHHIGCAVSRVDGLRIQIVEVCAGFAGDTHDRIVGKLPQFLALRCFLCLPVLVPLLLLLDQIV